MGASQPGRWTRALCVMLTCSTKLTLPTRPPAHPKKTGAYLSQPVTDKHLESGEDDQLSFGVASMLGWRTSREDAHAVR